MSEMDQPWVSGKGGREEGGEACRGEGEAVGTRGRFEQREGDGGGGGGGGGVR